MISQNKTTSFKKSAAASAITAALLFSVGGHAEESEDQSVEKNNVITVTANRREQSVQKVPFNISAISGDFLDDAQITDAAELMRSIAGVAVVDRGHRNSGVINGIMIRGLNVDGSALGDFALSAVPTVSTYVNDTPVYANFILKDIDRVEILRGPQSTLYGSGSLGGTVKYLVNRPELGEFSGKITAGLSSTNGSSSLSWDTDVILNIPLSDSTAIRFVVGKVDYAGLTDYVNVYELDENRIPIAPNGIFSTTESIRSVKDADTVDIEHARISILVEPNDQFSALFSYQRQSDDIGGRRQQTVGKNGFGESYGDNEIGSVVLEPSSREVDLGSLEMDLDLGFATLTSSTSKYNHRGDSISENTGFYAQNNWLSAFYYNYPRPLAEAQRTFSDKAFVQELRIVSNGDNDIDYVAGIFYQDQDLVSTQDSYLRGFTIWADAAFGFSATTGDKDFEYRRDQNFKDKAVFGELTYHFTDDYRMTFGGRFFSNKSVNDTNMTVGLYRAFSPTDSAHFVEK
ncbi:MAG: TonB-dependent receptor, partial [Kangiellaceae bacterium]|nr:TonB-dependent receptor [Kangiellaceae bacterium]